MNTKNTTLMQNTKDQISDLLFNQLAHKSKTDLTHLRRYGIDPFELQFSDRWLELQNPSAEL